MMNENLIYLGSPSLLALLACFRGMLPKRKESTMTLLATHPPSG